MTPDILTLVSPPYKFSLQHRYPWLVAYRGNAYFEAFYHWSHCRTKYSTSEVLRELSVKYSAEWLAQGIELDAVVVKPPHPSTVPKMIS